MKEAVKRQQIIEYAEKLIAPVEVDSIEHITTIEDDYGETDIWLLSCDTGDEYWVLEGESPANIFKKAGIYVEPKRVYEVYRAMLEEEPNGSHLPDRFHMEG